MEQRNHIKLGDYVVVSGNDATKEISFATEKYNILRDCTYMVF